MTENETSIVRVVKTNVEQATGYVQRKPGFYRWVFRYEPSPGEFHIYDEGRAPTVKEAVLEIYSSLTEYGFAVRSSTRM